MNNNYLLLKVSTLVKMTSNPFLVVLKYPFLYFCGRASALSNYLYVAFLKNCSYTVAF